MNPKNVLVTGPPRCGKSTLVESVIERLESSLTGFFTREIRERGRRVGFKIVTVDGTEGILAHDKIDSRIRVGKYGVNLIDLETIAVPAMIPKARDQIVVIDEIGKMECYSALFRETLIAALGSPNRVLATVAAKGDRFIEKVKHRADVQLIAISESNRDQLVHRVAGILLGERLNR